MAVYWDLMGTSTNTTTGLVDFNVGISATAGAYTPKFNGTLKMIRIITGNQAATSLVEGFRVELTCTLWSPNKIMFQVSGHGLHTAPGVGANTLAWDFPLDQPVATNQTITMQGVPGETTEVSPRIYLQGMFTA